MLSIAEQTKILRSGWSVGLQVNADFSNRTSGRENGASRQYETSSTYFISPRLKFAAIATSPNNSKNLIKPVSF